MTRPGSDANSTRRPGPWRWTDQLRPVIVVFALWFVLTEGRLPGIVGLLVIGCAAWIGARYAYGYRYRWRPLRLFAFGAYFLGRSVLGGLDVASRALHPRVPIDPRIVRRRLRTGPGMPRTLFVAATSLMPGTLSADVHGEELTVHVLSPAMAGELDRLEERVAALFERDDRDEAAPPEDGR